MHKSPSNKTTFGHVAGWGRLGLISGRGSNRILSVFNGVAATLMGTNVTTYIFITALCSYWRFSCCHHHQDETAPNLVMSSSFGDCDKCHVQCLLLEMTGPCRYIWDHLGFEGLYRRRLTVYNWGTLFFYSSFWEFFWGDEDWIYSYPSWANISFLVSLLFFQCQPFIFNAEQSHHVGPSFWGFFSSKFFVCLFESMAVRHLATAQRSSDESCDESQSQRRVKREKPRLALTLLFMSRCRSLLHLLIFIFWHW